MPKMKRGLLEEQQIQLENNMLRQDIYLDTHMYKKQRDVSNFRFLFNFF